MQNGSAESILCNSDLTVGGRRPQCQSVVCDTEQLNGQFQFLQHSCDGAGLSFLRIYQQFGFVCVYTGGTGLCGV